MNYLSIVLSTVSLPDSQQIIFALIPVFLLILLMGFLKISGDKSALLTLICTSVIAFWGFHYPWEAIGLSVVYGSLKAIFPILIIIMMAIFSYNVLVHTQYMDVIKAQFTSITSDKSLQVLLLTWGLGGLLEGMAGFGTAVAIPAALLISLGFNPVFAALMSLIANSVATGFGAVGTPVKVLAIESGVGIENIQNLSAQIILQLSPLMILIPFILMLCTQPRMQAVGKYIFVSFLVGGVSILVQYCSALYMGAETPAILGSIASIIVIIIYARFSKGDSNQSHSHQHIELSRRIKAWAVYGFILLLVILTSPLLPLRELLEPLLSTTFKFPIFIAETGEHVTKSITTHWLVDTGVLLFIGSIIGGIIQGASVKELLKLLIRVASTQGKTFVTVCSLISLSSIMDFAGMIAVLGAALAFTTGAFYPLFAPTIGCLGTFLTGSDTSSNILFGKLQVSVSTQIGENSSWLAAANTAGATGGKIISPQSIAVATSAIGQQGKEGEILKRAFPFALVYILIVGLVTYFLPKLICIS